MKIEFSKPATYFNYHSHYSNLRYGLTRSALVDFKDQAVDFEWEYQINFCSLGDRGSFPRTVLESNEIVLLNIRPRIPTEGGGYTRCAYSKSSYGMSKNLRVSLGTWEVVSDTTISNVPWNITLPDGISSGAFYEYFRHLPDLNVEDVCTKFLEDNISISNQNLADNPSFHIKKK